MTWNIKIDQQACPFKWGPRGCGHRDNQPKREFPMSILHAILLKSGGDCKEEDCPITVNR